MRTYNLLKAFYKRRIRYKGNEVEILILSVSSKKKKKKNDHFI
jgi:hypothetical protein